LEENDHGVSHYNAGRLVSSLLISGLIWSASGLPATAQDVSADQILNTLAPPVTRGLNSPQQPAISDADRAFIEGLRHRTRSLSLDEGDHVAELAKDRKKIDLTVNFDFNSAAITAKAELQLNNLGEALLNPRMENEVIVLGGHTDAKGSAEYNQILSERRAEAVKKYLIEKLHVSAENLSTVGYGKKHLLNTANPFAPENRRVQIINMSEVNQANR
jgi:outer membrane protein OmpA-like peptidoglycan-associated protein